MTGLRHVIRPVRVIIMDRKPGFSRFFNEHVCFVLRVSFPSKRIVKTDNMSEVWRSQEKIVQRKITNLIVTHPM